MKFTFQFDKGGGLKEGVNAPGENSDTPDFW